MPRARSTVRSVLALTSTLAAAAIATVIATPSVEASPINAVYREYYSNGTFTNDVGGRWVLQCSAPHNVQVWGKTSKHYIESKYTCPQTLVLPDLTGCYSDGSSVPCR